MAVSPARRLAAEVLLRVEQGGAFANLALDGALRSAGVLEPREVALCTELTYGALRWQLQLDRALAAHSDRPPEDLDAPVRAALRISTFELLHHPRVPAHAAVDQGVELVRTLGLARAAGYANAVLRRVSETRTPPPLPSRDTDPIGHIAALSAHPRWLVERWAKWLGLEETESLCMANQQQAPATLRVARRRATRERVQDALRASGIESRAGKYSPDALILDAGAPPALDIEGHEEGLFQAQDEAAQLVSLYAAPPAGSRVLDACAAPGAKACHLAELGAGTVVAVDLHARKAQQVEEAARRLGLPEVCAVAADATLPLPEQEPFDVALVDAPCSGFGTVRRHPEVKLRRRAEDVDRLAALQAKLLAQVARAVKPGGLLVYSVCTLTPEECDEQLQRFVSANPAFHLERPPRGWALPAAETDCIDQEGRLRMLPHRTGTDGFFAARFRKEAAA
ncbi:MAG TPA: 16S rRNA (cytosine(967)-C(5))-methyltransferase RsmB [Myxococcales bacterium]|nr:16S rRNA (cytosine(967)-C(5))-methyltransferase RsmB [Myxococcales bacterium]